jgi:hypothetical protein
VYSTRPPPSKRTFPYFEEPVLTDAAALAAVPDLLLERATGAAARSAEELAGEATAGRADATSPDAVLPQAANATAELSASTTVATEMVRDTRFLLCPGICCYDPLTAVDGATSAPSVRLR